MSYTITQQTFGKHKCYELTAPGETSRVSIIASCGALLNRFSIKHNDNLEIINGYATADELEKEIERNFKGVLLSPFANRVNHAQYRFNNKEYVLNKVWKDKDYAIHGYLFNKRFEVLKQETTDDDATLVLKNKYDGVMPGYPFTYTTMVIYTLKQGNHLNCETLIENTSEEPLPLSVGWHPLFLNDVHIDDLHLQFRSQYKIETDSQLVPTGKSTPYHTFHTLREIGSTTFDDCFKLEEQVGKPAEIVLVDSVKKIRISLQLETGENKFRYLQVYIPPGRNTIALEPMTSWPDAFNNQNDLVVLDPGKIISLNYSINVSGF